MNLIIDLDGTLYAKTNPLYHVPGIRIKDLINTNFPQFSPEKKEDIYTSMRKKYGSTLVGLSKEFGLPLSESFAYVHDINIENYISANDVPVKLLKELAKKHTLSILTSATNNYALKFLDVAGIRNLFSAVWGADDYGFASKAEISPYQQVSKYLSKTNNDNFMLVDDSINNVLASIRAGYSSSIYLTYGAPDQYRKNKKIKEIKEFSELIFLL